MISHPGRAQQLVSTTAITGMPVCFRFGHGQVLLFWTSIDEDQVPGRPAHFTDTTSDASSLKTGPRSCKALFLGQTAKPRCGMFVDGLSGAGWI